MSTSVTPLHTCPRCAATVRPGADWCSLCYADLRPAPEPAAAHAATTTASGPAVPADVEVAPRQVASDPGTSTRELVPGLPAAGAAPRGKRRRSEPAQDEVEVLAAQLVAQLAASEGGQPLGAASKLVDTTGKRAVVMIGGGVGAMLLIFLLMLLVGALL